MVDIFEGELRRLDEQHHMKFPRTREEVQVFILDMLMEWYGPMEGATKD